MEEHTPTDNIYIACPLCEENVTSCKCSIQSDSKSDSSCSLGSVDEAPLCVHCGGFTRDCVCEYPPAWSTQDVEKKIRRSNHSDRETPVREGVNYTGIRRNLFSAIPSIYLSVHERGGEETRPIFEIYNIKSIQPCVLQPGQTALIKSNIVVIDEKTEKVGFLAIVNSSPHHWLFTQSSSFFSIKEGVLSMEFRGVLSVSLINTSRKCIILRPGTNVGSLHFNRFI